MLETGSEWDFHRQSHWRPLSGRQLKKIAILEDYWFDWMTYNRRQRFTTWRSLIFVRSSTRFALSAVAALFLSAPLRRSVRTRSLETFARRKSSIQTNSLQE